MTWKRIHVSTYPLPNLLHGAILKNSLGTARFREKFLLDLIRNYKTIEINLRNVVNFP